ncbi:hypothetical protein B0J11DRAFT_65405 [Dendryphion nanum]|uniref:NAD(P)-binding protein n=1 Tax=Dendryphion nanum TaxID=256645 RepID=A0A9P9IF81_9PLEO|nr:hypothetical protein B0J11DRAFT_65405 [Dendryphion nanum]
MAAPPSSIAAELPPASALKRAEPFAYNPATEIPSLASKVILITGANSGIGKQTALDLSKHDPAQIWVAARSALSGQAAVDEIKTGAPEVDVRLVQLDLTSFESIKSAAREILEGTKRLDILILNAGIMGGEPGVTQDGYEKQFGTNHVGHALLLKLLTPLLLKTAEDTKTKPRVVALTSSGHKNVLPDGGIAFDTLKTSQLDISGISKYTQSKLANVVYARQFAAHYPEIISVAIHPGEILTGLFSKGGSGGGAEVEYLAKQIAPKVGVPVTEGAKNSLWAATAEGPESGRYYEPVGVPGKGSELSNDGEFGKKLWEWTEKELETQHL